jgi:hypothetical protein
MGRKKIMKTPSSPGPYPFLVEQRPDRDRRVRLDHHLELLQMMDGVDADALATAFGLRQDMPASDVQRAALLEFIHKEVAAQPFKSFCIVWSGDACTYVTANGPDVNGTTPPNYDVDDPRDWDGHPFKLVDCWTVDISGKETSSDRGGRHLALRCIGEDYVEISTASPCQVASLEGPGPCGTADPCERFRDANGNLRVPNRFRGVEITDYDEIFPMMYGPVQPDGAEVRVVPRWPSAVWKACREIAGPTITDQQLVAAWRAVAWNNDDMNHVGVLRAA